MLFFDRVVHGEVVAEFQPRVEEGAEAHPGGAFARGAGAVEEVPGSAEVFVLHIPRQQIPSLALGWWGGEGRTYKHIHMLRHTVIHPKLLRAHLRQVLVFLLGRRDLGGFIAFRHALLGHLLKRLLHDVIGIVATGRCGGESAAKGGGVVDVCGSSSGSPDGGEQETADEQTKH